MVTVKHPKRPRTVFVVSEAGSDLRALFDSLKGLGLRIMNLEADPARAGTALELIAGADFVCAALTQSNSPNVYLELGYALALDRPIAVISEASMVPTELAEQLWIKAPVGDRTAVTFQLQAFLANLDLPKPKRSREIVSSKRTTKPAGLVSLGSTASVLERDVLKMLRSSAEIKSIVTQPGRDDEQGYIPDFAVWLGVSSRVIESPVIIEVKAGNLGAEGVDRAVQQVENFARAGDLRTGLVVVRDAEIPTTRVAKLSPLIFVIAFDEMHRLLDQGKLVETLAFTRNRFVHSSG